MVSPVISKVGLTPMGRIKTKRDEKRKLINKKINTIITVVTVISIIKTKNNDIYCLLIHCFYFISCLFLLCYSITMKTDESYIILLT